MAAKAILNKEVELNEPQVASADLGGPDLQLLKDRIIIIIIIFITTKDIYNDRKGI